MSGRDMVPRAFRSLQLNEGRWTTGAGGKLPIFRAFMAYHRMSRSHALPLCFTPQHRNSCTSIRCSAFDVSSNHHKKSEIMDSRYSFPTITQSALQHQLFPKIVIGPPLCDCLPTTISTPTNPHLYTDTHNTYTHIHPTHIHS